MNEVNEADDSKNVGTTENKYAAEDDIIEAVNEIEEIDDDERKNKKVIISELRQHYRNKNLFLILGAGVSKASHIPLWNDFIKKMFSKMLVDQLKTYDKNYSSNDIENLEKVVFDHMEETHLIQMNYISTAYENDKITYKKIIHEILYGTELIIKTPLLKEIVHLCSDQEKEMGVKGIITYNFDDLVERNLEINGIKYNVISKDEDIYKEGMLNIYHVHGYLSEEYIDNNDGFDIVFSEEDYHRIYKDIYCWSNIIQLHSFREETCLFIGSSIGDPNLRRLLYAARRNESPRHYAILRKKSYQRMDVKSLNQELFKAYKKIDKTILERQLYLLGVKVIWVNDYNEIPEVLSYIK